jgi:hypothetical protein
MRVPGRIALVSAVVLTAAMAVIAPQFADVRWQPHRGGTSTPAEFLPAEGTAAAVYPPPGSIHPSLPDSQRIQLVREFRDPFYAFLVGIAEGDSLGLWTRDQLQAFLERRGERSQLPIGDLERIERRSVDSHEAESLRGVRAQRVWHLVLREPLRYPMPYSVLGHSLGSLSVARTLTFSEWRLGDRNVYTSQGQQIDRVPVTGLTVFRLDAGWIVMDVDGLLDKLLGGKLDDCWTQGFAICRQEGVIRGLALSWNRDLRPLCGEIDFATNEISPGAGPFAQGVAVVVRPWVVPDDRSRLWRFED